MLTKRLQSQIALLLFLHLFAECKDLGQLLRHGNMQLHKCGIRSYESFVHVSSRKDSGFNLSSCFHSMI